MRPFTYERAASVDALRARGGDAARDGMKTSRAFVAGGTTLFDLMKLDVMQPDAVIDINPLANDLGRIEVGGNGLRLGALVRMSEAADDPRINRDFPVLAQSLTLAASPQLRNMASLGGNVLQRTRCHYFRDTSWANCNKRNPGSGCAALEGMNRIHAVLGASDNCIATYPGDFAQALIALDAVVEVQGRSGKRTLAFEKLHRVPADTPRIETVLEPGDLITAFLIPTIPAARRSAYLKIRDRESYEFALASAAVALDIANGQVRDARIALGGVATKPWRAREAEKALIGKKLDEDAARRAGEIAFQGAAPRAHNAFKVALGRETVARALMHAAQMEI
ncbi:MAG: xanthine dehydrogenase family protein subunit M [Methylobacteriaceae bacterium]|nr:xanthine dehydrogenase family protein subunit M [Methylobacteriaceae bacterium]